MSRSAPQVMAGRVEALKRRAEHLRGRLTPRRREPYDHDRAELSALRWAIRLIEENPGLAEELVRQELRQRATRDAAREERNAQPEG